MAAAQTLYKSALAKSLLEDVERLSGPERSRVLERVAQEHLDAVRNAPRASWIDAAHQVAIDSAILEALGEQELEQMLRGFVSRISQTPLFRPILNGAIGLFGLTPASVYKVLPRAWSLTSKNAGSILQRAIDERTHEIAYRDLPALMRVPSMAVTTRGSVYGILDLLEFEGAVETDATALDQGTIVHQIRWAPKADS